MGYDTTFNLSDTNSGGVCKSGTADRSRGWFFSFGVLFLERRFVKRCNLVGVVSLYSFGGGYHDYLFYFIQFFLVLLFVPCELFSPIILRREFC